MIDQKSQPAQQHTVVTYNLLDKDGVVQSTHATFNTELDKIKLPPGMSLQVVDVPSEEVPKREVNHVVARAAEYPSVGDQLDVIWACFKANPQLLTSAGRDMLARITEVKAQFKKSEKFELNSKGDGDALYTPVTKEPTS